MEGNARCVNPLKQVMDAVGEKVECINYKTWGVCLPEGDFPATIGSEPFVEKGRDCINYNTWGVCLPEGDFPATIGSEPFVEVLE
ncbi:hypothetical protein T484DRAFT_1814602 [Baffinella frigidus]|nr:hypothetical protein T484DRAFT_1814602 [Cryptophyta sp. CCMP2293]